MATYRLVPTSSIELGSGGNFWAWDGSGNSLTSSNYWTALNNGTDYTYPTSYTTTNGISELRFQYNGSGATVTLGFNPASASPSFSFSSLLGTNELLNSITIYYYWSSPIDPALDTIALITDSTVRASQAFGGGSGTKAWGSISWAPQGTAVTDLNVKISTVFDGSAPSGTSQIWEMYAIVQTSKIISHAAGYDVGSIISKRSQYALFAPAAPISHRGSYYTRGVTPTTTTLTAIPDSYTPAEPDPWRPKLAPGFFYINQEQYYLYANKKTLTLGDVTFSVFKLAGVPSDNSVTVTYDGLAYTDWFIKGDELHFKHRDPSRFPALIAANYADTEQAAWIDKGFLGSPGNVINVQYSYYNWNALNQDFDSVAIDQDFTIRDNEYARYYALYNTELESERIPGTTHQGTNYNFYAPLYSPVVITDKHTTYSDSRDETSEFSVDEHGIIKLGTQRNLFRNPGFDINGGVNTIYEWAGYNSTTLVSATETYPDEVPYLTTYIALDADQTLYQTILIDSAKVVTVSMYIRTATYTSLQVTCNPINILDEYIDADGVAVGTPFDIAVETFTASTENYDTNSSTVWQRRVVRFGESNAFYTASGTAIPKEAVKLEIRFKCAAAAMDIALVQIVPGYEQLPINYLHHDATIEFESAPDENYVPSPSASGSHPYYRDDVDINPIGSEMPNGFLVWQDDGQETDYDLSIGGENIYIGGVLTSEVGRSILPYAKTKGFNKLRHRVTFHDTGDPYEDEIEADRVLLAANSVIPILPENAYMGPMPFTSPFGLSMSGSYAIVNQTSNSNEFAEDIRVETEYGKNVTLSCIFLDQFENPLLANTVTITIYLMNNTTTSTTAITNRAGKASYVYTGSSASTPYVERVKFTLGSVSFTFTMDVNS